MVVRIQVDHEMALEIDDGRFSRNWVRKQRILKFWWVRLFAIVLVSMNLLSTANADFVYSDVDGDFFDAVDISEVSASSEAMFGQPEAEDSKMTMPGFGFRASAIGTADFHSGLLEMTIFAEPGEMIRGIKVTEFGSFLNFGNTATSLIHTSAFVEVDGEVFSANTFFQADGTDIGNWEQELEFSFPETNSFRLVIDSQILAVATGADVAFIDQAGLAIQFNSVSSVPEPGSGMILLTVLMTACVLGARRKGNRLLLGRPQPGVKG